MYGHSFGCTCAFEAATRARNLGRLILYEGGPKPPAVRFIPDEFITRLEQLIAAGRREEAMKAFMLTAAGVAPEDGDEGGRSPARPCASGHA